MDGYPIGRTLTPAELDRDPHPVLARLLADEPVSWVPALDGWLVTRYDLAVEVLRAPDVFTVDDPRFSTSQVVGPSMLSLDGAEHARHREPFATVFRAGAVRERFAGIVEDRAGRLIGGLTAGIAELGREFAGPLAVAVVAEAIGLGEVAPATVLGWYGEIVRAVSEVTAGGGVPPAAVAAYRELAAGVRRAIAGGRSMLGDAVGRLSVGEVVANAAVVMFGGIDTTAGMILNAVRHVLLWPQVLAAVRAEPGLLANAVEESVRVEPAAAVVDRYATRDVRLGTAAIGRGELVRVSIAGANRDPAVFGRPDRFDVRRPNAAANLAFARGPHFCVGALLARAETVTAVRLLLERLPGLRLEPGRPHASRGLVFRKPPELWVRWDVSGR